MIKKMETALKAIENGTPKVNQWSEELLGDEDLLVMAVNACGKALSDIPKEYRTKRVCRTAFHKDPRIISEIPNEGFIYESELIEAIREGRLSLDDFSYGDKRITLAVCAEAIMKRGAFCSYWILNKIPENLIKDCIQAAYEHSFDDRITEEYATYEAMEDDMSAEYNEYDIKHIVGSVYLVEATRYNGHPYDHHYWEGADEYVRVKSA